MFHRGAAGGAYLAERQWGTVRVDYSADGSAWRYFTHDHARSPTEAGILGLGEAGVLRGRSSPWSSHLSTTPQPDVLGGRVDEGIEVVREPRPGCGRKMGLLLDWADECHK